MDLQKNSSVTVGADNGCVFTICNSRYLPQALVSLKTFDNVAGNVKTAVILVDAVNTTVVDGITLYALTDVLEFARQQGVPADADMLSCYTVTSLCTAIKPLVLMFCREKFSGCDYYVYTDPDTYWPTNPALLLERGKLHFFRHRDFLCDTTGYSGRNFLSFGGMNLGLIIDTGADLGVLKQWSNFSLPINLESSMLGYYTDQRPADLMVLSGRAKSVYDQRINLSYWNIADVGLTRREEGRYAVEQFGTRRDLSMFHFSGYKESIEQYVAERRDEYVNHKDRNVISALHDEYTALVERERALLRTVKIMTNSLGSSGGGEIYKFLLKQKIEEYSPVKAALVGLAIRSDFALRLIDRVYKIKNPLKI